MDMVIYKIRNKINNKIYIGKSIENNPNYFGSGISITMAIKKHGKNNFEKDILEKCENLEELNEKEKFWIKEYNSTNRKTGYNIAEGGNGGNTRKGYSDSKLVEYQKKISDSVSKSEKYRLFVHNTKGKKRPQQSKKMKELYSQGKIKPWNLGKKTSEETKQKISEKNRGKKLSEDARNKISKSKNVQIIMLNVDGTIIRFFDSIKDASQTMGINRCCISDCLNGRQKTAGGHKWVFKDSHV